MEEKNLFLHGAPRGGAPIDLWPYLITLFLILFPLDVFFRRVIIDYPALWRRLKALILRESRKESAPTAMMMQLTKKTSDIREKLQSKKAAFDLKKLEQIGLHTKETLAKPPLSKVKEEKKKEEPRPQTPASVAGPKVEEKSETYTNRLLEAKKKAWEKKK